MKRIIFYVFVATVFTLVSCTGDRGPMGPEGPEGPEGIPGVNIEGQTFEIDGVNFEYDDQTNSHYFIFDMPEDIDFLFYDPSADDDAADSIIAYIIEPEGNTESFHLLPKSYFLDDGIIQYGFNFVNSYAETLELTIEGNFDLKDLSAAFTKNQIFRFVVLPSVFVNDPNVTIDTYADLMKYDIDLEVIDRK